MNTRYLIPFFISVLLISACSGGSDGVPDRVTDPDWCYRFDFASDDYGAIVSSGSWVNGTGFQTVSGDLSIQYTHNTIVEPAMAIADISIVGSGAFDATLNIFGIAESYSDTIPFSVDREIVMTPSVAGAGSVFASVGIASDALITVRSLEVVGYGANPFPSNTCPKGPTPIPTNQLLPTLTPSLTPTNTPTATPSPTPSVSPTPTVGNPMIDFVDGVNDVVNYPYTVSTAPDTTTLNDPYLGTNGLAVWYLISDPNRDAFCSGSCGYIPSRRFDIDVNGLLTGVKIRQRSHNGNSLLFTIAVLIDDVQVGTINANTHALTEYQLNWSDTYVGTLSLVWSEGNTYYWAYGRTGIDYIDPIESTLPTYTPTGTTTPGDPATVTPEPHVTATTGSETTPMPATSTMTLTPTYEEQCHFVNYTFNNGLSGWLTAGTPVPGAVILTDGQLLEQNVNVSEGEYQFTLVAELDDISTSGDVNFDYTITYPSLLSESDSFTPQSTTTIIQSGNVATFRALLTLESGLHTFDIFPDLTGVASVKVVSVCLSTFDPTDPDENPNDNLIDDGTGWQTCDDTVTPPSQLENVGGWTRYLWNKQNQIITCEVVPPIKGIEATIEGMAEWTVGTALGFFGYLGDLFASIMGFLSNIIGMLGALFSFLIDGLLNFLAYIGEIISRLFSIIRLYFAIAGAWLRSWANLINLFVLGYFAATPITPPGLPDCLNDPFDHSLCAVYWTAENTILSGTIGSLIIPLMVIYIDALIFLYFIDRVRGIIQRIIGLMR